MKGTISKENDSWCIKLYSNKYDKRSIERLHNLLNQSIENIKETNKTMKRVEKIKNTFMLDKFGS